MGFLRFGDNMVVHTLRSYCSQPHINIHSLLACIHSEGTMKGIYCETCTTY